MYRALDIAEELGMPNPRNLNFVLGSIGTTLENLSKEWGTEIPPLQCLVVNKNTGLPGEGIGWFLIKKEDYSSLSLRRKRAIVKAELQHVFAYGKWREVLSFLSLDPSEVDLSQFVKKAASQGAGGGGESAAHTRLKEYVAQHPDSVGLPAGSTIGTTEYSLASGDKLDVHFKYKKVRVAAEVKSTISTTEVSKPSQGRAKRRLPDLCKDFDIECINTYRLIRDLDFRTSTL